MRALASGAAEIAEEHPASAWIAAGPALAAALTEAAAEIERLKEAMGRSCEDGRSLLFECPAQSENVLLRAKIARVEALCDKWDSGHAGECAYYTTGALDALCGAAMDVRAALSPQTAEEN